MYNNKNYANTRSLYSNNIKVLELKLKLNWEISFTTAMTYIETEERI